MEGDEAVMVRQNDAPGSRIPKKPKVNSDERVYKREDKKSTDRPKNTPLFCPQVTINISCETQDDQSAFSQDNIGTEDFEYRQPLCRL